MGKIVISLVCLISLLVLSGGVGAVTYVNSCTDITSPGVYVLTANIINSTASTCINITSSDVVLDGAGYIVDGVDDYFSFAGIYVHGTFGLPLVNVTVKSVTVTDWNTGIIYESVDNSTGGIRNVTASSNLYEGIYLDSSSNIAIISNSVFENENAGISLLFSSSNILENNTANSNHGTGIYVSDSSDNNTIINNNASNNWNGISLTFFSSGNILTNNIASNNYYGSGISLESSNNTIITNNTASNNGWVGMDISYSSHNIIINNTATSNSDAGIYISGEIPASNNTVSGNTIRWNYCGVCMDFEDLTVIEGNTIRRNTWGICLSGSFDNTIYNYFLNNTNNTYDDGTNSWNITKTPGTNIGGGQYLGGNYYSDYSGSDTDGDGLGDTPYNISGGSNIDYLPVVLTGDTTSPGDVNTTVIQRLDYYFNVSWTIPPDPDLKEFNIYQRLNDNASTDTLIDTVAANYIQPYVTGPGFDDGNLYQYMVTAVDTSGNEGHGAYAPEPPVPPIPFAPLGTLLTLGGALAAYRYYYKGYRYKRKRFRS